MFSSIPRKYRKWIYAALGIAGVVLGAIQVGYLAAGGSPEWLAIALAVLGFLTGAQSKLANDNVPRREELPPSPR